MWGQAARAVGVDKETPLAVSVRGEWRAFPYRERALRISGARRRVVRVGLPQFPPARVARLSTQARPPPSDIANQARDIPDFQRRLDRRGAVFRPGLVARQCAGTRCGFRHRATLRMAACVSRRGPSVIARAQARPPSPAPHPLQRSARPRHAMTRSGHLRGHMRAVAKDIASGGPLAPVGELSRAVRGRAVPKGQRSGRSAWRSGRLR